MEYIKAIPTPARNAPEKVAKALQWLRGLPAPPGVTIGPMGGDYIRHSAFKDHTAPLPFISKDAFERYMNRALDWIPWANRPKHISFSDEKIVFTQFDMDESNLFTDKNERMCVIDFGAVGLLPESFASDTMRSNLFAIEVAKYLDWPPSPNSYSMAGARAILWMISDLTLSTSTYT
ncbi:hypothetical protein FRB93_005139 [Tulasnella sp. JGI-2019a]|nr:hypothetical protein FRB93_005139 [Tulasnella sp. JGI-2019a]